MKIILSLMVVIILTFLGTMSFGYNTQIAKKSTLQEETDRMKEVNERTARTERRFRERLISQYHVTDYQIESLQQSGFGYGEMKMALTLAAQKPGGVEKNLDYVVHMRQVRKMGWEEIARELGVKVKGRVPEQTLNIQQPFNIPERYLAEGLPPDFRSKFIPVKTQERKDLVLKGI